MNSVADVLAIALGYFLRYLFTLKASEKNRRVKANFSKRISNVRDGLRVPFPS